MLTTIHLATYTNREGVTFRFAGNNKRAALRGLRALLFAHAREQGLKRHWFDPEEVEILEISLGVGYRGSSAVPLEHRR